MLGDKYALITYEGSDAVVIRKADEIELTRKQGGIRRKQRFIHILKILL